jgi:hypothetical protein
MQEALTCLCDQQTLGFKVTQNRVRRSRILELALDARIDLHRLIVTLPLHTSINRDKHIVFAEHLTFFEVTSPSLSCIS